MKHCHLYFTAKPLSVESLVLKSCVKMLLANQIVGFFKVQYLNKKYYCAGMGDHANLKYLK